MTSTLMWPWIIVQQVLILIEFTIELFDVLMDGPSMATASNIVFLLYLYLNWIVVYVVEKELTYPRESVPISTSIFDYFTK